LQWLSRFSLFTFLSRPSRRGKYRGSGLSSGSRGPSAPAVEAFVGGLRAHGWVDGQTIAIDYRWAGDAGKPLQDLAAELVRAPVDLIYVRTTPAALALKKTGTKVPVVFTEVSEPITTGLVASFARPGGNFTGIASINPKFPCRTRGKSASPCRKLSGPGEYM